MKPSTEPLFSRIAKRYDFMNHVMSFGLDVLWRKRLVAVANAAKGNSVLDMATGTGDVAFEFAKRGDIRVVGVDISEAMLERARAKAEQKKLSSAVEFQKADALNLPFSNETFDIVTMSFGLRNMPDYKKAVQEAARILKQEGKIFILEFAVPKNPFVRVFYRLYMHVVIPFLGGLFSERSAYEYLWRSVEEFTNDVDVIELMKSAGLQEVKYIPLTFGVVCFYVGQKSMS
ncbi:MAG: bifunctional demethylmenaquinone methyltransferase/2-methoxy-6-polyprenyl-1,4-benzoquinol methylase UbiE [bacterium]|nr:bifunctional demethylmenaquinone methyltransferase/2-methoxy-6-polyprenyl-1,4-benzoquinol methylase UbiE [bacterium]